MNHRAFIAFLVSVSGLLVPEWVAASNLGVARSNGSYSITRQQSSLTPPSDAPFLLKTGDFLENREGLLVVESADGKSLLVDRDSALTFSDQEAIDLDRGVVAVHHAGHTDGTKINTHGLEIALLEGSDESKTPVRYAIQALDSDTVDVGSVGGMLSVTALPEGNQVAVVGAGDVIRFARIAGSGWMPKAPSVQFSDDPTEGADATDKKKGGFLRFLGGGGGGGGGAAAGATAGGTLAVAAAGTAAVIGITAITVGGAGGEDDDNNNEDDNVAAGENISTGGNNDDDDRDDNDDERGESTPMEPPS